jgi:hypothetical protein
MVVCSGWVGHWTPRGMATFPRLRKAWWSIFTEKQASATFTEGARRGTTGCRATLHRGGFTFLGGAASPWRAWAVAPPRTGGGGHHLGLDGRGGGTSTLPRFFDGSLEAMRLLEEEEALGFTSWWPETVVLGFSRCRGWRSSWLCRIYIDKTANCQAVDHVPRNPCPLRRALGHKNQVVTRRRVTVHI